MKKVLGIVILVVAVVINHWYPKYEEACYRQELRPIVKAFLYGEEQLSHKALLRGEFKWIRVWTPNAFELLEKRMAKLNKKYNR